MTLRIEAKMECDAPGCAATLVAGAADLLHRMATKWGWVYDPDDPRRQYCPLHKPQRTP